MTTITNNPSIRKANINEYTGLSDLMNSWQEIAVEKIKHPHRTSFEKLRGLPERTSVSSRENQLMSCWGIALKVKKLISLLKENQSTSSQEVYVSQHHETGEVLGLMTVRKMVHLDPKGNPVPTLRLQYLITHPNHLAGMPREFSGIGKNFLAKVDELAGEYGIAPSLDAISPSIPFYEQHGYVLEAEQKQDTHIMFKKLPG